MPAGQVNDGAAESGPAPRPFAETPIFVAGATGYIGARLVPRLLDAGYAVRCIARSPRKLESRSWSGHPRVSIVEGDLTATADLASLMRGCGAAFYLVHSILSAGEDDTARDVESARRFAGAAAQVGLARIIYLGGLREAAADVKGSLASRSEVARVLGSGDVPATVLRAAMVIGSGSVSFEILRYLVERQPVMFPPKWVKTAIQPIAIRNVLHYLVACLAQPLTVGRTLDIGGPDVVTYLDLLRIMAEEFGLRRRLIVPLPVEMTSLSALWMSVTTPVSREMVRPLADGLSSPVVCESDEAAMLMPQDLLAPREAIRAAIRQIQQSEVESAWSDAGAIPGDPDWAGGRIFRDRREILIDAPPEAVFQAASQVGGRHGYYGAGLLWALRGSLDDLAGGPGLQRGRRDARSLRYGDAVDFWRVTAVEPGRLLRLQAEMKVPGDALLEFAVEPLVGKDGDAAGGVSPTCRLTQTATFVPRGLPGLAYWYSMLPFHAFIFTGMLRGIRTEAEKSARTADAPPPDPPTRTR
jgi:uncharacterized protein YbjT (DUF2867 family)